MKSMEEWMRDMQGKNTDIPKAPCGKHMTCSMCGCINICSHYDSGFGAR